MIKDKPSVFLDLDNTILDFSKAEHQAMVKTLTDLNIPPEDELIRLYSAINLEQWHRLELGLATRNEILTDRFTIFFERTGYRRSGAQARDLYENYLSMGHYFIDGAPELIETLYRDYDLYIASNGTAVVQAGRIKSAGIAPYFKEIFVSEDLGANKPDREYFMRCFERIEGFHAGRAVIIGDSLSSDILGGINAGIKTVWYNHDSLPDREDIKPDFKVMSLNEVPNILETMFK